MHAFEIEELGYELSIKPAYEVAKNRNWPEGGTYKVEVISMSCNSPVGIEVESRGTWVDKLYSPYL